MRKKVTLIITLIIILIAIDEMIKILVINNLQEKKLDYAFVTLTYSKNTGIALGMAKDNIVNIIITEIIVIAVLILFLIRQFKNIDTKTGIVMSMILAGGIGNFIDRIFYGGVIDYIDIGKLIPNFPIFNIADCLIIVGLILFVIFTFKQFSNVKSGRFIEEQRKKYDSEFKD